MGDEHHRHAESVLEFLDQLQDLRLDGHIERSGRLIRDQQLGAAGQRHGDHHTLAHAAGEPMRVLVETRPGSRDPHGVENPQGFRLGLRLPDRAVKTQGLGDLETNRQHRVQAGHRLLEDHRDLAAAHCPHGAFRQRHQVAALQQDPALDAPVHLGHQAHDGQRRHALARPRLPDDRHRLPGGNVEGQVFHDRRPHLAASKRRRQVADRQDRCAHCSPLSLGSMASRNPSPSRFSAKTMIRIATPGVRASQ